MRVAVSATGPEPASAMDHHFGRAACFLVFDEDDSFTVITNSHRDGGSGVGIRVAQMLIEQGVSHVLTGECGPKAQDVLQTGGIQVIAAATGNVGDAYAQFREATSKTGRQ